MFCYSIMDSWAGERLFSLTADRMLLTQPLTHCPHIQLSGQRIGINGLAQSELNPLSLYYIKNCFELSIDFESNRDTKNQNQINSRCSFKNKMLVWCISSICMPTLKEINMEKNNKIKRETSCVLNF